jgi:hypothetical protein
MYSFSVFVSSTKVLFDVSDTIQVDFSIYNKVLFSEFIIRALVEPCVVNL